MENNHCEFKEFNKKFKKFVFCKFPICKNKNNLNFCFSHLPLNEIGPYGKMILCPKCKNKIGENNLEKHLKKCEKNNKKKEISDENIINPRIWLKKQIKINEIDNKIIENLKNIINKNYNKFNIKTEINYYDFNNIETEKDFKNKINNSQIEGKNSKNILQQISMFENIKNILIKEKIDLNLTKNLFVELGCGSAELSKTFQIANKNSSFILIDRMKYTSKNKFDNFIKNNLINDNFLIREEIDIKNMNINKYLNEKNIQNVFFISKHLCGNACDLSLEKIIDFKEKINKKINIFICIATCCHYLLNNENYINFNYIKNELNINNEDFNFLCRFSSWGTLKEENENFFFGKKIKNILDYGRIKFLEENGIKNVKYVEYIESKFTKENNLILAYC